MKRLTGRQTTLLGMGLGLAAWGVVELLALTNKEEGDTISARAHDAIIDYPVVAAVLVAPVVAAVLVAPVVHFCTPTRRRGERLPWWQGTAVAIVSGVGVGLTWTRYDRSRV